MPIYGIQIDRRNPEYSLDDFTFWLPQFKSFMQTKEGLTYFNNLYPIANQKILYSIFGVDWQYAMGLCIAHYMYLIAHQAEKGDQFTSLGDIAGGGTPVGVLTSASIGGFSKSYDFARTMLSTEDAFFWNQSAFGQQLMALFTSKTQVCMFVANKEVGYLPPDGPGYDRIDRPTWGSHRQPGIPDPNSRPQTCDSFNQFSGCGPHKH